MSKVKKVRIRKVTARPTPTSWIYASTAIQEANKTDGIVAEVVNMILDQLKAATGGFVSKSGPGTVTIQVKEDEPSEPKFERIDADWIVTPDSPAYRRVALIGDEKMSVQGAYLGKRHGVIVRLVVAAGQILGVDKDVVCEVNLEAFANDFTTVDGTVTTSVRAMVDEALLAMGSGPEEIAKNLDAIKEKANQQAAEVELAARRREVVAREVEYGDRNWGGW